MKAELLISNGQAAIFYDKERSISISDALKKRLQEKNNMTLALEVLIERNIIFEVKNIGKSNAGRPLSTKYKVNNRIIEKW